MANYEKSWQDRLSFAVTQANLTSISNQVKAYVLLSEN